MKLPFSMDDVQFKFPISANLRHKTHTELLYVVVKRVVDVDEKQVMYVIAYRDVVGYHEAAVSKEMVERHYDWVQS